MKHPFFVSPFFSKRCFQNMAALGGVALLAGCQTAPRAVSLEPTPHTMMYSYLIANGMARGRMMAGRADAAQVMSMAQADQVAVVAILTAAREQSRQATQAANAALISYIHEIEK
ncbi:hypothetical protein ACI01nite_03630 [Acetobacter cibinongensis]|uniref:Lipoprotein n=3 Tax=Acetobacter cibinongensis TaxID=146475 RepID=A0ABQ0V1K7_9PROT|nr:hypothetical protein ACI01nite_03630 [Acetobacter cibinongensis]